jgi:hypothetical protein
MTAGAFPVGTLERQLTEARMLPEAKTWRVAWRACMAAGKEDEARRIAERAEREGVPLMAMME